MMCVTSQQGMFTPSWHLIFYMIVTLNSHGECDQSTGDAHSIMTPDILHDSNLDLSWRV